MSILDNEQYLGIDWGEKRIGLALAEAETKIALPFRTVANLKELIEILDKERISLIVIGQPIKMSGLATDNQAFLNFLKNLKNQTKLDLVEIDERLSSKAADALSQMKKVKANRDEIAAAIILQTYLDLL